MVIATQDKTSVASPIRSDSVRKLLQKRLEPDRDKVVAIMNLRVSFLDRKCKANRK